MASTSFHPQMTTELSYQNVEIFDRKFEMKLTLKF